MHQLLNRLLAAAAAAAPIASGPGQTPATGALRSTHLPALPQAIASFGACRSATTVYVYGGHIGREHAHSRANVVGTFHRLDLADPGSGWQQLPGGPALQGTALVAERDGRLWRLGGMTAHNAPDAAADLHSTATVACFDPATGRWHDDSPLPEPRSSHDAVVNGDHVYVVGGWHLHGGDDGTWLTTAWQADLRQRPLVWRSVPAPHEPRRAAALAAYHDGLVLLGGLGPDGRLDSVLTWTPGDTTWAAAPDLPGNAFGTAATASHGVVHATVADGRLLAWDGGDAWRVVGALTQPRFFHRLLPATRPDELVALGGATRGGHVRSVEVTAPAGTAHIVTHEIAAPERIAHRQALVRHGHVLWAFGGNRGGDERFAADQLADAIWRIDLLALTATRSGTLSGGRQSLAVASWNEGRDHVLVGGLGSGATGATVTTLATTWRVDGTNGTVQPFAALPEPRTQGQVVHLDGQLLALGGVDFRPDSRGGEARGDARAVWSLDPAAAAPAWTRAALQLPRPRRSFAVARLDTHLMLLGGLGDGFAPAGPIDSYDTTTRRWHTSPAPVAWVSPQAAVLGDRVYVACGGTMTGQRFHEDRALWSWHAATGWQCVVAELPFAVRHVQMLADGGRLLFYAVDAARQRIVLRWLVPPAPPTTVDASFTR